MAQLEGQVDQKTEHFDLRNFLENAGFSQYDKIEGAIRNKELTLEDILECNEVELKETLAEYHVKAVQRNRFVKAIKSLPHSKMNQCVGKNKNPFSNKTGSAGLTTTHPIINVEQQAMINYLSKALDMIKSGVNKVEKIHKENKDTIMAIKSKVCLIHSFIYNNKNTTQ